MSTSTDNKLVIIGLSNIISDLLDCALALSLPVSKIVIHQQQTLGERDLPIDFRLDMYSRHAEPPALISYDNFLPQQGESYLLGPTTPERRHLAEELKARFGIGFTTLIHPSAYVSPMATLSDGVFIGANSSIAPGVVLSENVFVNRGVTIGHDTRIGSYSRVQPGSNIGGLSLLGSGVTVGIGSTLVERLEIGSDSIIAGGAVVLQDVPPRVMIAGVPARIKKSLD